MPVEALSAIFRAQVCAALKQAGLLEHVPREVWTKNWVVHAAGRGLEVLDYVGRYVFRVAIGNSRLARVDNGQVTFRYRDTQTQQIRRMTLPGGEFLRRFLQHVLPRGCTKVRYYGLWSPSHRKHLDQARALLSTAPVVSADLTRPRPCPPVDPSRLLRRAVHTVGSGS